jgi:hypothetical protein
LEESFSVGHRKRIFGMMLAEMIQVISVNGLACV